jgi:hypothetical protein
MPFDERKAMNSDNAVSQLRIHRLARQSIGWLILARLPNMLIQISLELNDRGRLSVK